MAGHREKETRKLTVLEKINIEMDKKAKAFRKQMKKGRIIHTPSHYGDSNWRLQLGDIRINNQLEMGLRDHIQGTLLVQHLLRKGHLNAAAVSQVDWNAIHGGSKLLPIGDRLWMTKYVSGFCPTARQMFFRDQKRKSETQEQFDQDFNRWKSPICPLCKLEEETSEHILQCTNRKMAAHRKKMRKELKVWFDLQHTDPLISKCILSALHSCGESTFRESMEVFTFDEIYLSCASSQDQIGWTNFLFGRIYQSNGRNYNVRIYSVNFPNNVTLRRHGQSV